MLDKKSKSPINPHLLRLLVFTGVLQFIMLFYEWLPGLDEDEVFNLHYGFMAATVALVWFWYRYLKNQELSRDELIHLRKVADNASQAKTAFLANISHEIRTPLNGVIGMLGLLSQMQLTERQREYVDTIRKSSEQLLLVINDVLDIAKIEAGQLTLECIPFDISIAANDVVETFIMDCQRKNLQINIRHQADMPTHVLGDPGRVRQILTNLIGNAVKFTQRGHIYINLALAEDTPVGDKARFIFSVEDTGIGIPESKQKEVFERFSQADVSTTRRFGGTGLGLPITRELVRLMNGTMFLCSEENKGSIFTVTITLPLDKTEYVSKYALPSPQEVLRGLRVLVINESTITRRIMREMLGTNGASIEEVSTAAETMERLRSGRIFDMVLVDTTLSDADALTLGKQIHAISNAMLVVHTSIGQRGDASKFEQAGFAAYILNPFTYREFIEILSLAYARSKSDAQSIINYPSNIITRHMLKDLKENGQRRATAPQTDFGLVLIVEDDKVNQLVLAEILNKLGARTQIAENGQEGVEICTRNTFGLVLMDMNMPFMNGPDATRAIRKMETEQNRVPMPIVALTANAMKEHRDICLSAGMNDYLTKPVTVEKLRQVLQKWITTREEIAIPAPAESAAPSPATEDATSLAVDMTLLNELTDNNKETQHRLFTLFFESAAKALAVLEDAPLGTEDWKRAAHRLKGSAASLGAFTFSNTCAEAEQAEIDVNKEEMLERINTQYNEVRNFAEKNNLA